MKALAVVTLLAAAAAAGCVEPPALPGDSTAAPQSTDALQTIQVSGHVFSPGSGFDQVGCPAPIGANPAQQCDVSATVAVVLTGTLNGTEVDAGHFTYQMDGSIIGAGVQTFSGTIAGCGSGVLRMAYFGGSPDMPDPNHGGDIYAFDNLTLVPGSQTSGFAGVVDAHILMNFYINSVTFAAEGDMTGTVVCRPAAVPTLSPDHAGVATVGVKAEGSTPGWLAYDQSDCATPTNEGACELYFTEIVTMTGTFSGREVDTGHAHYHADGSASFWGDETFMGTIAGCGSGTLVFRMEGTLAAAPDGTGSIPGEETWVLLPGSTSTGVDGVTDARIEVAGHLNPATGAATATFTGTVWCHPTAGPSKPVPASSDKIAIAATAWTPGALAPDSNACAVPAALNPTEACTMGVHEILYPIAGNLNGTLVDTGFFHYNTDLQASADVVGFQVFTGSIPGCGSGSMTFTYKGHFVSSPDPTKPGYETGYDNLTYVPGSGTQGFAGVTDGWILEQGEINQITYAASGTVSGEMWCKSSTGVAVAETTPAPSGSPPPSASHAKTSGSLAQVIP